MKIQSLYQTFNRYRTLQTDKITSLPIVILMPHSSCNCRCVMCDIWKGNHNLRQLEEADIRGLLNSFKRFDTKKVVMSGGEALLHPGFFRFCEILKQKKIKISLLSTGLTIRKHAQSIVEWVDDLIISLDGDQLLHDQIRNIPGAFDKLAGGIQSIRNISPDFPVSGRTVIQRLNFRNWVEIIESAKDIGLDSISFLPADISSQAFNREKPWDAERQDEICLSENDLEDLKQILADIFDRFPTEFQTHFIAESPTKLQKIYDYYAARYGRNDFPYKKCNAPWVSTVIEADGTIRPCFFHKSLGNLKTESLESIINSENAISFRKNLDMKNDPTCRKCVCYLNLSPSTKI